MKSLILLGGLLAGYIAGLFMEHQNMEPKVKAAESLAEQWKAKDGQNYPLARQWRSAYEELHRRCQ